MLSEEIKNAQRLVRTDAYQMSIGEIVSMYESKEIIIHPDFQRLFRWNNSQKSKLIESLLLGIPLPSIFVFEKEDGKWELIDGLQRLSTILEFMGILRTPEGNKRQASILEATKYLPSLHNIVWEQNEDIESSTIADQIPLEKSSQLAIRRARMSVEILKRPSDDQTKFDLFQRLNAGGTQANPQELRNCIMLMINQAGFHAVKAEAERKDFLDTFNLSEDQIERQRHMEFAVRFLVHTNIDYDGTLDIEDYIDSGIINLLNDNKLTKKLDVMRQTFKALNNALGGNALKRFDGNRHVGKVGLVGLEGIAAGLAKNWPEISPLRTKKRFITEKTQSFWLQAESETFTSPGLRGTTRIQRTVPFGRNWFHP